MSLPPALARANALYDGLLAPLVLGGELRPIRPLGIKAADAVAEQGEAVARRGDALASRVEVARVRVARGLFPLDTLPLPSPDEWRLVAALNDVLQVANPYLPGLLGGSRPARLLALARMAIQRVPLPATLAECVARHATLARMLEIARTDTDVSWWTGSEVFRGETPPPRLLAWPETRRVRVSTQSVELCELLVADALRLPFIGAVGELLGRSPLTDLQRANRTIPAFAWTPATLALLVTPRGTALARRAIPRGTRADVALEKAGESLPPTARARVVAFLEERRALATLSP